MDWNATFHPKLSVPFLPPPEKLVIVYVASQKQFAIGHHKGGTWQVQPLLTGAVTHWALLTPPGAQAEPPVAAAAAPAKRDPVTARNVLTRPIQRK